MYLSPQIRSNLSFLLLIITVIALIDYQSWLLEQLYLVTRIPIQLVFTLEAVIVAVLAIFLYKRSKRMLNEAVFSENKLSEREQEVLEHILKGKSNKEIEQALFIEKSTLKSHINRIYKKLEVQNRDELMRRYSVD